MPIIEERSGRCYECGLSGIAPVFSANEVTEQCAVDVASLAASFGPATLCHGWPTLAAGPFKGSVYGHAWVEFDNGFTWDPTTGALVPTPLYYKAGCIDPAHVARYTPGEAKFMALAEESYGPWHDGPPGTEPVFAES